MDNLGYTFKIIQEFDQTVVSNLIEDCQESLFRNILFSGDNWCVHTKKQTIMEYFQGYFGLRAKLEGKLVFAVYHEDDPERILLYCAAARDREMRALGWGFTLWGNDRNGSKSWIWKYFTVCVQLYKPLVESLGLTGYYYSLNSNSDFLKKNAISEGAIMTELLFGHRFLGGDRLMISPYGFGQKYGED